MNLLIRTDGGSRGNPGPAGIGVVIEDAETGEIIETHGKFIGRTTNNQAEYQAAILVLTRAVQLHATRVEVVADSELLVKQARGEYRVKNVDLALRYAELKALEKKLPQVCYRHVRRAFNTAADALANQAMDHG